MVDHEICLIAGALSYIETTLVRSDWWIANWIYAVSQ